MSKHRKRNIGDVLCLGLLCMIILVLAACSDSDSKVDDNAVDLPVRVPKINIATAFTDSLIETN